MRGGGGPGHAARRVARGGGRTAHAHGAVNEPIASSNPEAASKAAEPERRPPDRLHMATIGQRRQCPERFRVRHAARRQAELVTALNV